MEEHRSREEKLGQQRVEAIKSETDRLAELLESNTSLTQQDKELTEQVAKLTREIRQSLLKQN